MYIASDNKEFYDLDDCRNHEIYLTLHKAMIHGFGKSRAESLTKKEKTLMDEVAIVLAKNFTEFMQVLRDENVAIKNVAISKAYDCDREIW